MWESKNPHEINDSFAQQNPCLGEVLAISSMFSLKYYS